MPSFAEKRNEPNGSYRRTRWAVIRFSLVILLLLLVSCTTMSSSRKDVSSVLDSKISGKVEESFQILWEKWTVNFGAGAKDRKLLPLISSLTMTGGRGGGENEFPLHITATLMDSSLIEAGLQYYADTIQMAPEEKLTFGNAYYQRFDVENHLLIWCELQTSWTELFLDLNRWIIFIEDDALNQYEPVQVLEESQFTRKTVMDSLPEFNNEPRRPRWKINHKSLMLCFPKKNLLKNPIFSERIKFLKLVFQLTDDSKTRAEGTWVFKKGSSPN